MKLLRLLIGLNLISALLVAGAIGYGIAFPGGELLFDLRSERGFVPHRMDVRTYLMRALPIQSPNRNQAQWSPNGKRVAYLMTEPGGNSLYVSGLTANAPRAVMSGDVASSIAVAGYAGLITDFAWSPDSTRIAVAAVTSLWMIDVLAASPPVSLRPIATGSNYRSVAWSPDGTRLAFDDYSVGNYQQVYVYNFTIEEARLVGRCTNPDWSPDGRQMVCVDNFRVLIVNVDSGEVTPIGEGFEPAWSPDGDWIACSVPDVQLMLYYMDSAEVSTVLSNGMVNLMSDWRLNN